MPCYNNEKTIAETLKSLQEQSYPFWEGVFVDDGSSDATPHIIKKFSQTDDRFKYFKRDTEKRGGSICRNIGLAHCTGEYVMFLDADDLLTPGCLLTRLNKIDSSNYDFIVFTTATFGSEGVLNSHAFPTVNSMDKDVYKYLYAGGQAVWHTSSTLLRKSFVDLLGGFDTRFKRLQDVEFHFRAIVESKERYEVVSGGVYDSLYRITESEGVKYKKFQDSLASYMMMSEKMSDYIQKGLLIKNKHLSKAYLLLCTRYVRTLALLKEGGIISASDERFDWVNYTFLERRHRLIINRIKGALIKPGRCLRLCRFIDYLLRKCIVGRCC